MSAGSRSLQPRSSEEVLLCFTRGSASTRPARLSRSEGLLSNFHVQRATLVKGRETCSLPCPLRNEVHCAHRLKSEPRLNLNLLFWSAYLVCRFLIHLPSFSLPGGAHEREVGLKVTYAGAAELVRTQPRGTSPTSSFQETATSPLQRCAKPCAEGTAPPPSRAVIRQLVSACNGKINIWRRHF